MKTGTYGLMLRALSLATLLPLTGCLTPVGIATPVDVVRFLLTTTPDIRDLGPEPTSYKQLVEAYMIPRLFDHDGARYEDWSGPSRGWIGDRYDGYVVFVTIHDKDTAGSYSAPQYYEFVLHDDKVILCRKADERDKYELDCPPPRV